MVTPSAQRIEFRQTDVRDTYETADSSYTRLQTIGAAHPNDPVENITIKVTTTDGTQMSYEWKAGAFRCSRIKDRNGNYITINHDAQGLLRTVTDTLGRIVTVNYDAQLYPTTITQQWKNNNGAGSNVTHTWALFAYTTKPIDTDFSGLTVFGPPDGTVLKVLDKVTYADSSYTKFYHNSYAQVYKIENYAADNHKLNQVRTNLESPTPAQTDCPRFTETRQFVENFNNQQETVVTNSLTTGSGYSLPGGISGTETKIEVAMTGHPHNAVSKTWVGASGWNEGLPIATEDWADGTSGFARQRWTWTNWTQDNTNLSYILNPRVIESRVGDVVNTKKTTVEYLIQQGTNNAIFGLASAVNIYDTDLSTILKRAEIDFNLDNVYISRRIIGLQSETRMFGRETTSLTLASKATYGYDEENFSFEGNQIITPIYHNTSQYGASFVAGRANLTSATRWDVFDPNNASKSVRSKIRYDISGSPVARLNPLNKKIKINYADSFNDSPSNRNTFAYPTTITDPELFSSSVKYRFDIGANVWAESPAPQGQTEGKKTERIYDSIGRLQKERIINHGGAYTRYEYLPNGAELHTYTTVTDLDNDGADIDDEVKTETLFNGAGLVRAVRKQLPESVGGWSAVLTEYDILGRVRRQSIPTEVNNNWFLAGDGVTRGWLWNSQEYDWKGRTTRSIPSDSNGNDGKDQLFEFEGCGCAGGEIVTMRSELVPRDDNPAILNRRTAKIYHDILGRNYKTELLNWTGGVYSTTMNKFNCRDQVVRTREHEGSWTTPRYQTTSYAFDGHGRTISRHLPQQDPGKSTQYSYYADDRTAVVTDARGATANYQYNDRGAVQSITYTEPTGNPESSGNFETCDPADENCEYPMPRPSPVPDPSPSPTPLPTPTPTPTPTPSPTPGVINVSFEYDAAGNRTSMTDPMGSTVYEYDQLSRMLAETRQFSDSMPEAPLSGNRFRLQYQYELSGALKSLRDPYGQQINYGYDEVGRLDSVTGSPYGGITNYATNPEYSAWGALEGLTFGNGLRQTTVFNNRLLPNHFELMGNGQEVMKKNYEYLNDGRLRYLQDQKDAKFDRLNIYDHLGRIKQAKTGLEARGGTVPPASQNTDLPYRQMYEFNQYSNLTRRDNLHWGIDNWQGLSNNLQYAYYNDRIVNQHWRHDADGRVLQTAWPDDWSSFRYDARGLMAVQTYSYSYWSGNTIERFYNGDGREVKRKKREYRPSPDPTHPGFWIEEFNYYVRSTVLGGEVISEVSRTGKKNRTFVHAAGAKIAWHAEGYAYNGSYQQWVYFEHSDASGMSHRSTMSNGEVLTGAGYDGAPAEVDPFGGNVGLTTPYVEPPTPPDPPIQGMILPIGPEEAFYVNGQRVSCNADGMSVACPLAFAMLSAGSADIDYNTSDLFILGQLGIFRSPIWGYRDVSPPDPKDTDPDAPIRVHKAEERFFIGWQYHVSWAPPQQTQGPKIGEGIPPNIRQLVSDLAKRKACADILAKLADKLKEYGKLRPTDPGKTFIESVFDSLKLVRIHSSAGSGATIAGGTVNLRPAPDANRTFVNNHFAKYVLQELLHRFQKGGNFNDSRIDRAALDLLDVIDPTKAASERKRKDEKDFRDGSIAHRLVNQHCQYSQQEVDNDSGPQ